jgi:hypothetical protein
VGTAFDPQHTLREDDPQLTSLSPRVDERRLRLRQPFLRVPCIFSAQHCDLASSVCTMRINSGVKVR